MAGYRVQPRVRTHGKAVTATAHAHAVTGPERVRVLRKLSLLEWIASRHRRRAVERALADLRKFHRDQTPLEDVVRRLHAAWGNPDYTASVSYLIAAARLLVSTSGPVLECGSGLSTLMLGALAEQVDLELWTLENEGSWHAKIARDLEYHMIRSVRLCYAPLMDYGNSVSWYDLPKSGFPERFSLVICDGPPNWTTPGARYGLIAAMRDRLAPSWNVLLDDANAAEKTGTRKRLESEPGVRVTRHDHDDGSFLWITRQPG